MIHTVFYVIIFFVALIVSNVINKVFPKLPLPLIQVVFGLILGVLGAGDVLRLNSELFLAFIIGPLLFREGEEADVKGIVKHGRTVTLLVFPVVFLTTLIVGIISHNFYAAIPLTACFALGASLGPTDAVAVSSLSERFDFPKRIIAVLKGEGLFNDASGIIAFQFAILALTTGEFSLGKAVGSLALSAIGGALVGFLVAWLNRTVLTLMEDVAAQDVTGYLMLEIMLPLLAFFLAEEFHVSGIIAVVVAGVMQAGGFKKITLFDAQVESVSKTVWDAVTFILNSIVFLFLGIELQQIVTPIISNAYYDNFRLLLTVLVLTATLFIMRYVILSVYYAVIAKKRHQKFARYVDDILLLTFSGVKGTVSVATILLLPEAVAQKYSLLIFLAASVTVVSFLTGILVLPIIAPKKEEKVYNVAKIAILTTVVEQLERESEKGRNKLGYIATIDNYQARIRKLIINQESATMTAEFNDLQLLILRLENEGLENAFRNNEITIKTYRIYQRYLKELERSIVHRFVSSLAFAVAIFLRVIRLVLSNILHINIHFNRKKIQKLVGDSKTEIRDLYFNNTSLILDALESLEGVYNADLINYLQSERLRASEQVATGGFITRIITKARPNNLDEMMRGYYLERKLIFEYEAQGLLTAREAKVMRKNVNALENYSMNDNHSNLLYDFLEYTPK
ncbi:sodium:proton antiporter [Lactococcus laudensis]|uniref:Sodium:proton antiporter n=1 Tax=Pseudolactococcus laudensis TaxID=1494461 RepID=A0A7V8SIQ8_9LACT|nr:sodium:proton antiporter [Lactococcus laudensis]MBA0015567.1 sodium:proton antiporter [Lactococcus laudensis]MBW9280697.1 sodium:proton antiporter [Lactococcus laudensis]